MLWSTSICTIKAAQVWFWAWALLFQWNRRDQVKLLATTCWHLTSPRTNSHLEKKHWAALISQWLLPITQMQFLLIWDQICVPLQRGSLQGQQPQVSRQGNNMHHLFQCLHCPVIIKDLKLFSSSDLFWGKFRSKVMCMGKTPNAFPKSENTVVLKWCGVLKMQDKIIFSADGLPEGFSYSCDCAVAL